MASEAAIMAHMAAYAAIASEDNNDETTSQVEKKVDIFHKLYTSLRKLYTFNIVEEFWCLYDQIFKPSKLPTNADFHLFKAGIEPKWEDLECVNGGKRSISNSRKATLDNIWLEIVARLLKLAEEAKSSAATLKTSVSEMRSEGNGAG